jgi:adenylylsulfate kinase
MKDYNKDAHLRSILKAVSYRLLAAIATTTVAYIFTRRIYISIGIGLAESVVKIMCYYVHERMWSFISFGRKAHPLSGLQVNRPLEEKDMEIIKSKLKELGYIDD